MGLSRRAYAALRGVHESAVRKAIATGRIALETDGTIDAAKTDAMGEPRPIRRSKAGPNSKAKVLDEAYELTLGPA
jgi:hypothetical protein